MFCLLNVFCLYLVLTTKCSDVKTEGEKESESAHEGFQLVHINYERVSTYLMICLWLLSAIIARIVFHYFKRFSRGIPESCLLIVLGVAIGAVFYFAKLAESVFIVVDVFFLILLPPNTSVFFENFWTIISFAINGTLFNSLLTGVLMFACRSLYKLQPKLTWMQAFLFGSIVSAVDPVAVLAVFEELHVNEILYIIVFGESILNDAVTVVLYNLFSQLMSFSSVGMREVGMGVAMFLIDAFGGMAIGIAMGIIGSLITRFTKHVTVIEPLTILLVSYISYLISEIFHFSGILAIFFCGILLKYYTEINVCNQSRTAIKYFIKTLR
ncbi:Sodium/hydrogen exchanger 2 [Thelohanellus kitauei]|uniref:Sodium/hydrogen exchanger n=1 Tax=Thelohanellus kitauei TaxID=669202 RepID=A0A0C2MUX3_THEKT|nr:Sodium/hydrogen exchanger 2 [Thelohanellus kitauei]